MHSESARTLRALAAFLVTAGIVLLVFVGGVLLREVIAPPSQTWSAWTRGAVVATCAVALVFLLVGWVLSERAHRARRDSVRSFLTREEREHIARAIREAEAKTSGEVVVHMTELTHTVPTLEARRAFEKIGMTRTRERNGVLIFVSVRDRKLAVIGDRGINERVSPDFWADVITQVEPHLSEGRFGAGLVHAIQMAGAELARHFPRRADDVNELPDDVSLDGEDSSD